MNKTFMFFPGSRSSELACCLFYRESLELRVNMPDIKLRSQDLKQERGKGRDDEISIKEY